jgi:glutathione synthase/RimK-type ligase-like ATP-grasp enzyme
VRIAFVTTAAAVLGHDDVDRPLHEAAFARAGMDLHYCVWWDPEVPWDRYDLVVIRSPWDYVSRLDEYRRWLSSMDLLGTLRNPAALVAWNLDKRYLLELGSAGVPVISTHICLSLEELLGQLATSDGEVVVKPVVSAGSADTGRFDPGDPKALALGRRILEHGMPVMVQPAIPSVATEGEVSAVLFGGGLSHAFRKGPMLALGGGVLDGYASLETVGLTSAQDQIVRKSVDAVSRIAADELGVTVPPLYVRVDLVRSEDEGDVVLEVELNEPSFFLTVDAGAADRFAAAVRREVDGGVRPRRG